MKKNKTIAYMLAAAILVGGTFAGTKALFTDNIDAVGELKISTGDVDIEVVEGDKWTLHRMGDDTNTGTGAASGNVDFDNLKTGDYLTKTVKIENKGTLKASIELSTNSNVAIPAGLTAETPVVTELNGNTTDGILSPGEQATVTMKVTVTGGGVHNTAEQSDADSFNTDKQEQAIIDLNDAWILNAEQVNGTEKQEVQN